MAYLEESNYNSDFVCTKDKHNVFLIGDSIREGYCCVVKEELADIANVFYINDNNRNTQYLITNLKAYSTKFQNPELVDLIHFNCGHWDIAHWNGAKFSLTSIEEYARNLEIIISMIKNLFPHAIIVFATTTHMNPNGEMGLNVRTNKEIAAYNFVAKQVCDKKGVLLNDLNEYVESWGSNCYKDYCHYTDSSNKMLGKEIANRLRCLLI